MGVASSKLFREHISCFSSFAAADAACSPVFWSGCAEESSWTPISEIGRKMQLHRRHTKKVREVMEGDPQGEGTLYAICYMLYAACCMLYAICECETAATCWPPRQLVCLSASRFFASSVIESPRFRQHPPIHP